MIISLLVRRRISRQQVILAVYLAAGRYIDDTVRATQLSANLQFFEGRGQCLVRCCGCKLLFGWFRPRWGKLIIDLLYWRVSQISSHCSCQSGLCLADILHSSFSSGNARILKDSFPDQLFQPFSLVLRALPV